MLLGYEDDEDDEDPDDPGDGVVLRGDEEPAEPPVPAGLKGMF